MKPLLSAHFNLANLEAELAALDYPMIGSPKIDGYRMLILPQKGACTRKLIQWPNKRVWLKIQEALLGCLDGEVVVGPPYATGVGHKEVFNRSSPLMRHDEDVDFTFYVFDDFTFPNIEYSERLVQLERAFRTDLPWLKFLEPKLLESPEDVLAYEAECLEKGYEGIMIRSVDGPYKYGRSTLKQQIMIKLKRTLDDDAKIIGFEPRCRNDNPLERDELGYAKRSSHQENLVPLEMLGAFIVKCPNFEEPFNIGSGFDHHHAELWWRQRDQLLGKWISFKYLPHGTIKKPRHPIFLHFRHD